MASHDIIRPHMDSYYGLPMVSYELPRARVDVSYKASLPRAVASYDLSPNGICKILLCSPGILRPPMAKASYGLRWPPMASGILMPSWYHIASSGAPLRLIYGLEPRQHDLILAS